MLAMVLLCLLWAGACTLLEVMMDELFYLQWRSTSLSSIVGLLHHR